MICLQIIYKQVLALSTPQGLICHKTPTHQPSSKCSISSVKGFFCTLLATKCDIFASLDIENILLSSSTVLAVILFSNAVLFLCNHNRKFCIPLKGIFLYSLLGISFACFYKTY